MDGSTSAPTRPDSPANEIKGASTGTKRSEHRLTQQTGFKDGTSLPKASVLQKNSKNGHQCAPSSPGVLGISEDAGAASDVRPRSGGRSLEIRIPDVESGGSQVHSGKSGSAAPTNEQNALMSSASSVMRLDESSSSNQQFLADENMSYGSSGIFERPTTGENICRICHEGDALESLISPCMCRGTLSLVHRTCLEHWLAESDSSNCELCRFRYVTRRVPKYSLPWSFVAWLKLNTRQRRALVMDSISIIAFIPFATLITYFAADLAEGIEYQDSMSLKEIACNKSFGGLQKVFTHESSVLKCTMTFGLYLPPDAESKKVPVIYWLSGLTCTHENFMTKAGAQQHAAANNFILVIPDTSPRGCNIPGEDTSYDFGSGAGFYVDATQDPWKTNYNMYSYITQELPALVNSEFPADPERQSIMGHSMGGHGALICYMKNPGKYRSVSAFSPICNPTQCPWGRKAFAGYLGPDEDSWKEYDATCLVSKYDGPPIDILIDQGSADQFLEKELLPDNLVAACKEAQVPVILQKREGYDHSYFYIATFIGEHIKHHAKYLNA